MSDTKPFTAKYVVRETLRHMQRPINISTQKTIQRMQEFKNEPEKTAEAMSALASLVRLNRLIESIRENNKELLDDA